MQELRSGTLLPTMQTMFDQLGGLGRLVKGKTVAIKINLTGSPSFRLGYLPPAELAHWTHPQVIGTAMHLMDQAGARRIRLLESPWSTAEPLEEYMLEANWEPPRFAGRRGPRGIREHQLSGRWGDRMYAFPFRRAAHMFRAYDLNHSYEDCDVFVSIAKMKDHATAGVTLSDEELLRNYALHDLRRWRGSGPALIGSVLGGRGAVIHSGCDRQPSKSAPSENHPGSPRDGGYRVPRVVADLIAARP